ncbi:hypothetical protein K466DRAFT_588805 [Polyporus arcularius HHB13444]|uniref:Uncharacterized protein n=1 Tax=Polyporus arcularius HHB13444 TaxID=1314778 RepID=A0A5C3P6I1_9APHY|nr:hypothetical protein K466DRAFT_588805 [Polyporus arcularius HHB13444]
MSALVLRPVRVGESLLCFLVSLQALSLGLIMYICCVVRRSHVSMSSYTNCDEIEPSVSARWLACKSEAYMCTSAQLPQAKPFIPSFDVLKGEIVPQRSGVRMRLTRSDAA